MSLGSGVPSVIGTLAHAAHRAAMRFDYCELGPEWTTLQFKEIIRWAMADPRDEKRAARVTQVVDAIYGSSVSRGPAIRSVDRRERLFPALVYGR